MNSMVIWPIVSALWAAIHFVGGDTIETLQPTNLRQQTFIEQYVSNQTALAQFKDNELRAWASDDINALNEILKKEGFSIRISPDADFGVVSILDILVEWAYKGEKTQLQAEDGNTYPGVSVSKGMHAYQCVDHEHPIFWLETKSGDTVCMTVADKPYASFDLLERIKVIRSSLMEERYLGYASLIFPMIQYEQEASLDWLVGMGLTQQYEISDVLQQTKFKMNEIGAHVKSAVAISFTKVSLPRIYTIDRPFLVWIERPGLEAPIFAGYMDYAYWQDPGTLDL